MKTQGNHIIFESGRHVKDACKRGPIRLGPHAWDDAICSIYLDDFEYEAISQQERIEIVDYMIGQWKKVKQQLEDGN